MTFTARSALDPQKTATFTLHNGSVSIELGDAIMSQVNDALDAMEADRAHGVRRLLKPVAAGSLQRMVEPFPVEDFRARVDGEAMHATAWLRVGGLRLAPVTLDWEAVDNPAAATAFVEALQQRRVEKESPLATGLTGYWATWVVGALLLVALPVVFFRFRRRAAESEQA